MQAHWPSGTSSHPCVAMCVRFAAWMAAGDTWAHGTVAGTWTLQVRCTFAHCYSGGFFQEFDQATTAKPPRTDVCGHQRVSVLQTASGV